MGRNPETIISYSPPTGPEFRVIANGKSLRIDDEQALRKNLSGSTSSFDIVEGDQRLILDIVQTDRGTIDARVSTLFGRSPNGRTPSLYGRAHVLAIEIATVLNKTVEFSVVTEDEDARQWALSPQTRAMVGWDETFIRDGKFFAFKEIQPLMSP